MIQWSILSGQGHRISKQRYSPGDLHEAPFTLILTFVQHISLNKVGQLPPLHQIIRRDPARLHPRRFLREVDRLSGGRGGWRPTRGQSSRERQRNRLAQRQPEPRRDFSKGLPTGSPSSGFRSSGSLNANARDGARSISNAIPRSFRVARAMRAARQKARPADEMQLTPVIPGYQPRLYYLAKLGFHANVCLKRYYSFVEKPQTGGSHVQNTATGCDLRYFRDRRLSRL